MSSTDRSPLLTTDQVAERLGCHRRLVMQLIASGDLKAVNIGGRRSGARYRIDQRDLDRWLESRVVRDQAALRVVRGTRYY